MAREGERQEIVASGHARSAVCDHRSSRTNLEQGVLACELLARAEGSAGSTQIVGERRALRAGDVSRARVDRLDRPFESFARARIEQDAFLSIDQSLHLFLSTTIWRWGISFMGAAGDRRESRFRAAGLLRSTPGFRRRGPCRFVPEVTQSHQKRAAVDPPVSSYAITVESGHAERASRPAKALASGRGGGRDDSGQAGRELTIDVREDAVGMWPAR